MCIINMGSYPFILFNRVLTGVGYFNIPVFIEIMLHLHGSALLVELYAILDTF
jgi:hypothetical protein